MWAPSSHHRHPTGQLTPAAISALRTSIPICPWAPATPCSTIITTIRVTSLLISDPIRTMLEGSGQRDKTKRFQGKINLHFHLFTFHRPPNRHLLMSYFLDAEFIVGCSIMTLFRTCQLVWLLARKSGTFIYLRQVVNLEIWSAYFHCLSLSMGTCICT